MLNPLSFISKFIKSSNQRELDRLSKIVSKINSLEEKFTNLKDSDFPNKTLEFKEKIKRDAIDLNFMKKTSRAKLMLV